MIAATGNGILNQKIYLGIVSAILFLSAAHNALSAEDTAATNGDDGQIRISRSLRFPDRDRAEYSKLEEQIDSYKALSKTGDRTSSPSGQQSARNDFWFYTADVILFNDMDGDGFFWSIDLLFDVDTYFEVADVYAVAYLSFEGGPWNEYAVTDTFPIFGATSDDAQVIITDLVSGYPTGHYDLLIELFDAFDGTFLASFGPADTSELSFLPLEDSERDKPFVDDIVVVGHGGGGAAGWWMISAMLLLLLGTSLRNNRERRQEAPVRQRKFD